MIKYKFVKIKIQSILPVISPYYTYIMQTFSILKIVYLSDTYLYREISIMLYPKSMPVINISFYFNRLSKNLYVDHLNVDCYKTFQVELYWCLLIKIIVITESRIHVVN